MKIIFKVNCRQLSTTILFYSVSLRSVDLTCIFNQSLLNGIYPFDWKLVEVSPVFKNVSKTADLNKFRPIFVIPAVSKIFEKYLWPTIQLFECKCKCKFINQLHCQSDFRYLHSTLTVVLESSNNWFVNVDKEGLWHYRSQNHLAKTC